MLLAQPSLYAVGREAQLYRSHSFWVNIIDALFQSTVIFFIAYGVKVLLYISCHSFLKNIFSLFFFLQAYDDTSVSLWEFGTVITTSCIFVMLIHVGLEFRSWVRLIKIQKEQSILIPTSGQNNLFFFFLQTPLHLLALLSSVLLYMGFALAYNAVCVACHGLPNPYWVMQHCLASPLFWATVVLTCVISLLPRYKFNSVFDLKIKKKHILNFILPFQVYDKGSVLPGATNRRSNSTARTATI